MGLRRIASRRAAVYDDAFCHVCVSTLIQINFNGAIHKQSGSRICQQQPPKFNFALLQVWGQSRTEDSLIVTRHVI